MLQELMKHPNIDLYNRCNELINKYFEPLGDRVGSNEMDMSDSYNNHNGRGLQNMTMQSQFNPETAGNQNMMFGQGRNINTFSI